MALKRQSARGQTVARVGWRAGKVAGKRGRCAALARAERRKRRLKKAGRKKVGKRADIARIEDALEQRCRVARLHGCAAATAAQASRTKRGRGWRGSRFSQVRIHFSRLRLFVYACV